MTWIVVALVWAAICVIAGRWQWHRWQDKSATQHRIDTNYDARPVPLASVLSPSRNVAKGDEWKQVQATGHYVGPTLMVRNRPNDDGDFGYEAANVFEVDGVSVLVDRGWVANGRTAAAPASVPDPPRGEVHLVGWVRPGEKSLGRPAVSGQLSSLSVKDAGAASHRTLAGGYVRMRTENPDGHAVSARPQVQGRPSQGMAAGINLSYAFQWWAGAIAGLGFVLLRARREHLDALEGSCAPGDESANEGLVEQPTAPAGADVPRSPRPKREKKRKHRIWDDEDE